MVSVPLGVGAYLRKYSGEPEIRLLNRFVERNPTNLQEHTALLARPGTNELSEFAGGGVRGCYAKPGLFAGDLFVVSGPNLYRYAPDGTLTPIAGIINGSGHPNVSWMKGIGYEFLFIADGLLLQYYDGGSHATGTLTLLPAALGGAVAFAGIGFEPGPPVPTGRAGLAFSGIAFAPGPASPLITTQVLQIGTVFYGWGDDVDANAPDGTSAHPWLAKVGTDDPASFAAMANLISFNGTRGVDFSTALGGPSTVVTAEATAVSLVITAISQNADGNAIVTLIFDGGFLTWSGATLVGGGIHALHGTPVPDGLGAKALASVSGYVLVSIANSQKFFWINPGETIIDPLNFAEKESNPDNIVDMLTVGDQVLITGQGSTENWYATGALSAPFAPIEGRVFARGTLDGTPVVVQDIVILVGDDGKVYAVGAEGVKRISDHGIEERIRSQLRREQGL